MFTVNGSTFKVNREKMLTKLQENLEVYRAEYKQALVDYRLHLLEHLMARTAQVQEANPDDHAALETALRKINLVLPSPPGNHEAQYIEAIEMLSYASQEEVEIDRDTFKAWVMNDWKWMGSFKALAASYNGAR